MKIEKNNGEYLVRFENLSRLVSLCDSIKEGTGAAEEFRACVHDIMSDVIVDYLVSLPLAELVEIWNCYLDKHAMSDSFINKMDMFDFVMKECTDIDYFGFARAILNGCFDPDDDYFYIDELNEAIDSFSSLCGSPIVLEELAAEIILEGETFGKPSIKSLCEQIKGLTVE